MTGWGTWIRTKIDGVRVRCSTVELSPNGLLAPDVARWGAGGVNSEAGPHAQAFPNGSCAFASRASNVLDRDDARGRLERAGDRRAHRIAAGQADFHFPLLRPEHDEERHFAVARAAQARFDRGERRRVAH